MELIDRFMAKVNKDKETGCWNWIGAKNGTGYGCFWINGITDAAARVSYRLFIKDLSSSERVTSTCRNKACVNPEHLALLSWDILDRFLAKVNKNGDNGCWIWTASSRCDFGYGTMEVNYHYVVAHRVSYKLFVGEIPDGMCVLHKCDNPPCVNPDHLFLGTKRDNMLDMESKGRGNHPSGEKARAARNKLKQNHVKEIRSVYSQGRVTQKELSKRYGVSLGTINCIVNNVTWKET